MSEQISGTVIATKVKPTKNPDYYMLGFKVGERWYNMCTTYPDNVKQGDKVTFTYEETQYGLKVSYRDLKKDKSGDNTTLEHKDYRGPKHYPQKTAQTVSITSLEAKIDRILELVEGIGGTTTPKVAKKQAYAQPEVSGDTEFNDKIPDFL